MLAELPGPNVLHSSGEVVAYAGSTRGSISRERLSISDTYLQDWQRRSSRCTIYAGPIRHAVHPVIVALVTRLKSRGRLKPKRIVVAAMRAAKTRDGLDTWRSIPIDLIDWSQAGQNANFAFGEY